MKECKNCKFYSLVGADPGQNFGWCHRFPPTVQPLEDTYISRFPTVGEDSQCGEFKDKDDSKNSVELAR